MSRTRFYTIIDSYRQVCRCERCGEEIPIPLGLTTWVSAVMDAFNAAHQGPHGKSEHKRTRFSTPTPHPGSRAMTKGLTWVKGNDIRKLVDIGKPDSYHRGRVRYVRIHRDHGEKRGRWMLVAQWMRWVGKAQEVKR